MKKPFYLVITSFFPTPSSWRGPFVYDQVKALMKEGTYDVVVFKPRNLWSQEDDYEIGGIKVHHFGILPMPSYIFDGVTDWVGARYFLQAVARLGIDMREVAVIHAHTVNAAAYGLAAKKYNPDIRVVVQHHGLDPFIVLNGRLADWRINARFRARHSIRIFNAVDLHLCISYAVKDSLLSFPQARIEESYIPYLKRMKMMQGLPPIRPKSVFVLHNGVDTEVFKPLAKPVKTDDCFRIGCIANFMDWKDHPTLLKAFDRLIKDGNTNYRLWLIGSGMTMQACEDFVRERNLVGYVEWHNEVSHQELPKFYQSLDLFVLPSVFEGFGCVYTEAYACGIPFMACRNQGAAELIADEEMDRWTIVPGDDARLSQIIAEYDKTRATQHLKSEIDLTQLVEKYVKFLNSK